MNCPHCGLINSSAAQRSDCGYDFKTQSLRTPYIRQEPAPPSWVGKVGGGVSRVDLAQGFSLAGSRGVSGLESGSVMKENPAAAGGNPELLH